MPPLDPPNLDDRRLQDIVDETKRLIPRFTPEWTNHNLSDPGVALVELFAWVGEMVLYRVNQVPDRTCGWGASPPPSWASWASSRSRRRSRARV